MDGSACDYCWIIAPTSSRPTDNPGCQAKNHSHAPGEGQWEALNWWIRVTQRNFDFKLDLSTSSRYVYTMGGGFPGHHFAFGGCDGPCQWQQKTADEAEKKVVQCRECFARQQDIGHPTGGGSEIKTAWMFGGHLWSSGTPGYVKPYTPDGADVNYEQLCFMVST